MKCEMAICPQCGKGLEIIKESFVVGISQNATAFKCGCGFKLSIGDYEKHLAEMFGTAIYNGWMGLKETRG